MFLLYCEDRCAHSWSIFQHSKRNFVSPRGHEISSIPQRSDSGLTILLTYRHSMRITFVGRWKQSLHTLNQTKSWEQALFQIRWVVSQLFSSWLAYRTKQPWRGKRSLHDPHGHNCYLLPLTPTSNKYVNYPYNFNTLWSRQVMRIKKIINCK